MLKIVALVYSGIFLLWSIYASAVRNVVIFQGFDGKSLSATLKGTGFAMILVGSGLWYAFRPD